MALELAEHERSQAALCGGGRVVGLELKPKALAALRDELRADVGREDHKALPEGHRAPAAVCQAAVLQNLQRAPHT